jgi:hypothetical protein
LLELLHAVRSSPTAAVAASIPHFRPIVDPPFLDLWTDVRLLRAAIPGANPQRTLSLGSKCLVAPALRVGRGYGDC